MDKEARKEEPEALDKDTLAALDEGIASAQSEAQWPLEDAIDFAKKRRAQWQRAPKDRTA